MLALNPRLLQNHDKRWADEKPSRPHMHTSFIQDFLSDLGIMWASLKDFMAHTYDLYVLLVLQVCECKSVANCWRSLFLTLPCILVEVDCFCIHVIFLHHQSQKLPCLGASFVVLDAFFAQLLNCFLFPCLQDKTRQDKTQISWTRWRPTERGDWSI